MNKKSNISSIAFTTVFVLVIIVIGAISMGNLAKFYVNDEVDYNEWSADLGNKQETDIATTFFEKYRFVNLNGAVRNLLGQREMNGVVKLNNGYLLTTFGYVSDEYLQKCADSVAVFDRYLENRGTRLVYASVPYTSSKYDPQLPEGVSDYGNDNIDRFLKMLDTLDVDTIDFRETMHQDGIDQYDMMYKTDHHWNTEAGLYAYGKLEQYIVGQTGCDVDERISDIGNYTITTYEKWHLGSRGQRVGRYFAGIDDFDLIIPNFDTSIRNDVGEVGSMQELVINMKPLNNREYTSRYTYDRVLEKACAHYINLDCRNDLRILIISDSSSRVVCPYLMMGFHEMCFVSTENISEMSPEYIESYDPDVVIMLYYPQYFYEGSTAYDFAGYQ